MTERSDLANLRTLGEPRIHDWGGARDAIGAGLVEWTRLAISHDHRLAVRAALEACALVVGDYPADATRPVARGYVEHMVGVIRRWFEQPTREHSEEVRSSLDVTRERHAWQPLEGDDGEADAAFWILEAVDHACLTVWAGERASYIVPMDFATTAGRVSACVYHAMRLAGQEEDRAANAVIDVVLRVTA